MNWSWKLQNKTVTNRGKIESSFNNESKCQGVCNVQVEFYCSFINKFLSRCAWDAFYLCILMAILYLNRIIWKRKTRFWSYANINYEPQIFTECWPVWDIPVEGTTCCGLAPTFPLIPLTETLRRRWKTVWCSRKSEQFKALTALKWVVVNLFFLIKKLRRLINSLKNL